MIQKTREMLGRVPFQPFVVHTSGGREYRIVTTDHAQINPHGTQVNIWFDDKGSVTLEGSHITAFESEKASVS